MKTTKKQFRIFSNAVEHYVSELGLRQWDVHAAHSELDEDSWAQVSTNERGRIAYVELNKAPSGEIDEDDIPGYALHECLHIKLQPLVYLAENPLEATQGRVEAEEHSLIHFIQGLIEGR